MTERINEVLNFGKKDVKQNSIDGVCPHAWPEKIRKNRIEMCKGNLNGKRLLKVCKKCQWHKNYLVQEGEKNMKKTIMSCKFETKPEICKGEREYGKVLGICECCKSYQNYLGQMFHLFSPENEKSEIMVIKGTSKSAVANFK